MASEQENEKERLTLAKIISLDDWRESRGEGSRINAVPFRLMRMKVKKVVSASERERAFHEPGGRESTELENIRIANYLITVATSVTDKKEKIRLAEEAISVFPHCSAAFNILALEKSRGAVEKFGYFKKGVDSGEFFTRTNVANFGKKYFELERHPYLISLKGAGDTLWEMGEHESSLGYYWKVIRLDENDKLGAVQILAARLLELGKGCVLDEFLSTSYAENGFALPWVKGLHHFKEGRFEEAHEEILFALKNSPGVFYYISGEKDLPKKIPPYEEISGMMLDAWAGSLLKELWHGSPAALEWVKGIRKNFHH